MSPGTEIGPQEDPPPKLDFNGSAIGTMFTTGQLLIMSLSLEDPVFRAGIIADVCKEMKIPVQDIVDEYNDEACPKCGFSLLRHRDEPGGRCP